MIILLRRTLIFWHCCTSSIVACFFGVSVHRVSWCHPYSLSIASCCFN